MLMIRLARGGAKNNPFYRIVTIDRRQKRGGKPVEVLGYWYPKKSDKKIDKKRYDYWVGKGAKTSKAVLNLLED